MFDSHAATLGGTRHRVATHTGYRFARYYTHDEPYVRKGPPPTALRILAPGVVLTPLALFGTGVALLLAGPPSNTLIFAHKLSFIA